MTDLASEAQAIEKLTAAAFAAEVRRDLEAFLSYFAPDVVVQAEGAPTITGAAGLRSLTEESFKMPFTDIVLEPRTVVVAASGDFAYDIGPWKLVFEGDDGVTEAPGKSTLVWQKSNGDWKVAVMSFSMDSSPASSTD